MYICIIVCRCALSDPQRASPSTPLHVVSSACPAPSFVHLAINYVYVLLEFSLHASKPATTTKTTQPVALLAGGDSFTKPK